MGTALATSAMPLKVAVVGSGPSGFYTAEALLKSPYEVHVDLLEYLPTPFGLVRSGVAPDHQKLKGAIKVYEGVAEHERLRFFGNVKVGRDIAAEELSKIYHAVIYTCGAETDRKLAIPGEDLTGSHTATEFVGWYNGHPDYQNRVFDFSVSNAVIIGQGNVAADVARILAKTPEELMYTDITENALRALRNSKIRNIYVVGRRGAAQAKFSPKELREFSTLGDCTPYVAPEDLELNEASRVEVGSRKGAYAKKTYQLFQQFSKMENHGKSRVSHFAFLKSPVRLRGVDRVREVILEKNLLKGEAFLQSACGTGEMVSLECGIFFRSIGYRGVPIPGIPFDARSGRIPNEFGRVKKNAKNALLGNTYVAGWIKRGPSGIIGTNRACAVETVKTFFADMPSWPDENRGGGDALCRLLNEQAVSYLDYVQWKKIDKAERLAGEKNNKPREKLTTVKELIEVAKGAPGQTRKELPVVHIA